MKSTQSRQENIENMLVAVISFACERLEDYELAALNLVVHSGFDPRPVMGYEKVKHLFSENDRTKMHEETKQAFIRVVNIRLSQNS